MSSLRVLLVDDHPGFLEAARCSLAECPEVASVFGVSSRSAALKHAATQQPHVVLIGLSFSRREGFSLVESLKDQPNAPYVVLLGLDDSSAYRIAAEAAGADGFLCKENFSTEVLSLLKRLFLDSPPSKADASRRGVAVRRKKLRLSVADQRIRAAVSRDHAAFYDQGLANHLPVGVYQLVSSGRLQMVNPALRCMLGYGKEQSLLTVSFSDWFFWGGDYERCWQALEREEIVDGLEMEFRRRDGASLWVRHSLRTVRNEQREVEYYEGVIEDISTQKRVEHAMRQSEERLRAIFEKAAVGISFVDEEGNIIESNEALLEMLGYSAEELQHKGFVEVTYPSDRELALDSYVDLVIGERDHYQIEKRYVRKNGEIFWGRLTVSKISSGDAKGFAVGMVEDITKRKQAEEAAEREKQALAHLAEDNVQLREWAEQATQLKNEFLGTISHELRTPLHIILGYLGLTLEGDFGPLSPEQHKTLSLVTNNAEHLHRLINGLLDVSQLETRQNRVEDNIVDALALRKELVEEFVLILREKPTVSLIWNQDSEPVIFHTDRVKCKIILRNLLHNAIKFTNKGTVRVEVVRRDGGIQFCVTDTGVGIPSELQQVIFEMFRQGDRSSRSVEGLGLGLYISRRLIVLLQGTLTVKSEVGKGSTFCLWIPDRTEGGSSVC